MSYDKFLPKAKAKTGGIMVRPDKETAEKIETLASKHGCSANALVIAIIKSFFDKEAKP